MLSKLREQYASLMEQDIKRHGGVERIDLKLHGELADIVKDLADADRLCLQAEYYRTVIDAMGAGEGREDEIIDPSDPMSIIRDMIMSTDPETRMRIRNELNMM